LADRTVTVNLRASVAQYLSGMAAASKSTSGFAGGLARVGAGLTKFVSVPVVAAGAASIKFAMDWESAFAGVRKTVDASEPALRRLESGLRSMATQLPATHEEIAGVAEAAGQLGIKVPNIESFTRTMVDMGETTDLSANSAAEALARLGNIMQMPEENFRRLASAVVDLGNKGAATEAEIVAMGLRIAGAGHQVGLSEAQVVSFGEALSSVGIRAEAGGSAISKAFITIHEAVAEGGKSLSLLADTAAVSVPEFSRLFAEDAAGAMTLFIEGLGRVKKEGGDVFAVLDALGLSEIRVRDAMLRLAGAGDLLRNSLETGNAAWEENNALTAEAQKRYRTTESQMRITWNQIKDLAITIGQDLLPHFKTFLEYVRDGVKAFSNLSPEMQKNILKWAGLLAVLGPSLLIISKLVGAVRGLGMALGFLGGAKAAGALASTGTQLTLFGTAAKGTSAGLGAMALSSGYAFIALGTLKTLLVDMPRQQAEFRAETESLTDALRTGALSVSELSGFLDDFSEGKDTDQFIERLRTEFGILGASTNKARLALAEYTGELHGNFVGNMAEVVGAFERYKDSLTRVERGMVSNLLKVGDYKAALSLLNDALGFSATKSGDAAKAYGTAGDRAKEAAHKADAMAEAFNNVPDKKDVKVNTPGLAQGVSLSAQLGENIGKLHDKTVTITVIGKMIGENVGSAAVGHAGGLIGSSMARRMHAGGIFGAAPSLRGDEGWVIGQRGERLLSVPERREYERLERLFAAIGGPMTAAPPVASRDSGIAVLDRDSFIPAKPQRVEIANISDIARAVRDSRSLDREVAARG